VNNEPAFPCVTDVPYQEFDGARGYQVTRYREVKNNGLSLRDYFAAKAMQGLITGCYSGDNCGFTVDGNVVAAYEYADAMLKERSK